MNKIDKSIIASNGSTINNASINIKTEKRKSFFHGFFWGFLTPLFVRLLWYFIENYLLK